MNVMQLLLKRYRRKINKVIKGGGVLSILFAFFISLVIPPFNIFADDYSGSTIQGFNVSLIDVEQVFVQSGGTSGYMGKYIYEVEFILDDSYVGYINVSGEIKFYPYNSSTLTTYSLPGRNYFVNGSSFKLNFQLTGDGYTADNRPSLNNTVFTYGNHNLYKHSEIDSLETIIDLLTDLYNNTDNVEGLLNSQITQLASIISNTSLSNNYLDIISKIRQYNFPIESFGLTSFYFNNNYVDIGVNNNSYYQYPIFDIKNNDRVGLIYLGNDVECIFIFGCNQDMWNKSKFLENFSMNNDFYISMTQLQPLFINNEPSYFYRMKFKNTSGSGKDLVIRALKDMYVIPIYLNYSNQFNMSTEFALQWGLSNSFLDNINIIVQGTTQSNTSSSNLETQKGSFDTTSNDLYTSENAFNTDMNNKLQSIDTSFNPSISFGSKFLSSADWVRTQFNNLTSTSPFGTVLSFSMLLGLSLLIIGKVFK